MVLGTFGPEVLNLLINSEETAAHLAKKFGVPDGLIRDPEERKQIVAMAQQMQMQQQQQMQEQPPQEQLQ
jgi:phage portal protein BeeE